MDPTDNDVNHVRRVMRQRFLDRRFNITDQDALWDSDKGARDFTRATSWFLIQDVWKGPRIFDGDIGQEQKNKQLVRMPNRKQPVFNTSIRWDAFCRWAVFLGFAVRESKGILPDPTNAVVDAITNFTNRELVPLQILLTHLAEELPVVDGGEYRSQVEEKMLRSEGAITQGPGAKELSPTLSHALLRLFDAKVLELTLLDDAETKHALSGVGSRRSVYSHVRIPRA